MLVYFSHENKTWIKNRRWAMQEKEIGKFTHYFAHVSAGIIELSDALKVGDKIEFFEGV